jgi:hypothetical protein
MNGIRHSPSFPVLTVLLGGTGCGGGRQRLSAVTVVIPVLIRLCLDRPLPDH